MGGKGAHLVPWRPSPCWMDQCMFSLIIIYDSWHQYVTLQRKNGVCFRALQMTEALQLQMEMQKQLHEQLEVFKQRNNKILTEITWNPKLKIEIGLITFIAKNTYLWLRLMVTKCLENRFKGSYRCELRSRGSTSTTCFSNKNSNNRR